MQFQTRDKKIHSIRSLCDNGSQVNLITKTAIKQLKVELQANNTTFIGMGGHKLGSALGRCMLSIHIPNSHHFLKTEFFVVNAITNYTPQAHNHEWSNIKDKLADPNYNQPGKIHALLGLGTWIKIVEPGILKSKMTNAMAQNTKIGYVIFKTNEDPYQLEDPYIGSITEQESTTELIKQIQKLWELEKLESGKSLTLEQKLCEEIFQQQHSRDDTGRYSVRIPFNEKIQQLGKSKSSALRQFFALEARMKKNNDLAEQYKKFMADYISLGHMERIFENEENGYYTPHHAIFSSEKKFRTVFNASAKTTTGITLNDTQMTGEKIQPDLFFTLINFRKFKYGITADIEKMYRQILINKEDRKFQKILWRSDDRQPIGTYELKTVTYGHTCAPHCAIRTLKQCGLDHANEFPLAAKIVQNCFYVDDLITGTDTAVKRQNIQDQVTKLLAKGGFNITKWKFNDKNHQESEIALGDKDPEIKSVLGLYWNTKTDKFSFKFKSDSETEEQIWTKRKILSKIGKLYDPNGFIGPIVFQGKLIIQQLWKDKSDWDQELPIEIAERWNKVNSGLKNINHISINRWLGTTETSKMQLHGFCDASEVGYGAVIYSRIEIQPGEYQTTLIASKSRIAPLKTTTIPRLELCAANLLAELTKTIQPLFKNRITETYNWSDSRIILCWLNKTPSQLKVFVANRIANIQEITEETTTHWRWTSTKENPADILSRGIAAEQLIGNSLWWKGPNWLQKSQEHWPNIELKPEKTHQEVDREMKTIHLTQQKTSTQLTRGKWFKHSRGGQQIYPLLELYESWTKLNRVTATFFRAWRNFKKPITNTEKLIGTLTNNELYEAENYLLKQDQEITYSREIQLLKKSTKGTIGNLSVLWDEKLQLIRLDGRIHNEFLSYDEQYPILLSKDGKLARPLIRNAHHELLHGGNQLIQQYLRKRYWITRAKDAIKNYTKQCPVCFKLRMKTTEQQMSALPDYRTSPELAFVNIGIDYAGPFTLRPNLLRGRPNQTRIKAYIAVFICLVTRAIHLELVSDISTKAFIAALKRMIFRRGLPAMIVSDNATNFVGAKNYLDKVQEFNNKNSDEIKEKFKLDWKFTTPVAPHHGGIYEAAVKSTKYHLRRVIGEQSLTFEEFSTILCQVEGCLNS